MGFKAGAGNDVTLSTDITKICTSVASRGVIAVHKTAGSGDSLGDHQGQVEVAASATGKKPAGLLLTDHVSVDETVYARNWHKRQMLQNEPCTLLLQGRRTVNGITGTPTAGDKAYLTDDGEFTTTLDADGGLAATPWVGTFDSAKDENGYATINFNFPQN